MSRVEVVEIIGFGRSGSTLLDRLLASALDAPGMGELVAVWRRGVLEDRACSCGEKFSSCPFWQQVVATAPECFTPLAAADVVLITNRMMRAWGPLLVRSAASRRELVRGTPPSWFAGMAALYVGVSDVSGRDRLIDSSKAPVIAYLLAQIPELRVRPVALVRDPRAVAWAWGHPGEPVPLAPPLPELTPARAALVWSLVNSAARRVIREMEPGARVVRYEDLVADPTGVVARIVADLSRGVSPWGATASRDPIGTAGQTNSAAGADHQASHDRIGGGAGYQVGNDRGGGADRGGADRGGADRGGADRGGADRAVRSHDRAGAGHTMSSNPRIRFDAGVPAVVADRRWQNDLDLRTWSVVTALTLSGARRYGYPLRWRPRMSGAAAHESMIASADDSAGSP